MEQWQTQLDQALQNLQSASTQNTTDINSLSNMVQTLVQKNNAGEDISAELSQLGAITQNLQANHQNAQNALQSVSSNLPTTGPGPSSTGTTEPVETNGSTTVPTSDVTDPTVPTPTVDPTVPTTEPTVTSNPVEASPDVPTSNPIS